MVYIVTYFTFNRRNYGFLAFQFFLPSLQVILFCLAIGQTPTGLRLAVCNEDVGYAGLNQSFAQIYLEQLDSSTITQVAANNTDDVGNSVYSMVFVRRSRLVIVEFFMPDFEFRFCVVSIAVVFIYDIFLIDSLESYQAATSS